MARALRTSIIRDRRVELGLTQTQLASRAGVSRQLVAAVEAGQNTPAVDAAIRLSQVLHMSVEELFASGPPGAIRSALGGSVREGTSLRVGRVGDQLVVAELPEWGTAATGWAVPDGVLRHGKLQLFAGADPDGLVLAGCEPALQIAEGLLDGRGSASLTALSAPTGTALAALADTTLHAAVVHGRPGHLPRPPVPVLRLHLARWQVGLGIDCALGATDLESLCARRIPIVQRDQAAASQRALERATRRIGAVLEDGPRANGHIDAARCAERSLSAGLTTEAVARAFGLQFVALEEHTVEIWIARQWQQHPAVAALGDLLTGTALTQRLGAIGGYDLAGCGTVIAPG
jgi:transcriptional regulator with XRE-family HTH domain